VFGCGLTACSYKSILVPNPPVQTFPEKQTVTRPAITPAAQEPVTEEGGKIDFALAFGDSPQLDTPAAAPEAPVSMISRPSFPRTTIRTALRQNITNAVFYSMGEAKIRSSSFPSPLRFRGRLNVSAGARGSVEITPAAGRGYEAALPCTLSAAGLIALDERQYRGSMIIQGDQGLTVVNSCGVE
jgi:hypothetical protein